MTESRQIIAVCAAWVDEENLNLFLSHLIPHARKNGYLPVCLTFDRNIILARGEDGLRECRMLFELENLAGIILFGEMIHAESINRRLIEMGKEKRIPVFMMERMYEGCINIRYEFRSGFEKLVRHIVIDHGCRNVVMVAGFRGNSYSEERIEVCRTVLEEVGAELPEQKIIYGDFWDTQTRRGLKKYFASGGEMPEAFICANDAMALAVSNYLNAIGINVPDEVRVTGFDGILMGERHLPGITTGVPDFDRILERMMDCVKHWNPEQTGRNDTWPLSYSMKIRQSCGCEKQDSHEIGRILGDMLDENLDYAGNIKNMGSFVRSTLNVDSVDELIRLMPDAVERWPDSYYCICVLDESDRDMARTILHGENGLYVSGERFCWKGKPAPDFDEVLRNEEIIIIMAHLLQTPEETMGYMICGVRTWNLREEQRFEEHCIFMSSVLRAVLGNGRLRQANEAIRSMAEHDFLTGIFNRRGFLQELNKRLENPAVQGKQLVLFSVDMDGLKRINDVYGHAEGDVAIRCIGRALELEAEHMEYGLCARYGGDEFALAGFVSGETEDTETIRERIEKWARKYAGDKPYRLSASLGGCIIRRTEQHPPLEQMLEEADRALYRDKTERKTARE